MELTHRLRVPAPPNEAWAVVSDPSRVGALLPGTTVDPVDPADPDMFTGTMRIKLGSMLLALVGTGRYVTRDEGARRAVVSTTGVDRRGDAAVEARHTITLVRAAESAAETDVSVTTSMTWTGRPARLGEGVVADAADRTVEQTGARVAARVAEGRSWAPGAGEVGRDASGSTSVVDHPVELGDDLGDVDAPVPPRRAASSPAPAPSPGPAPRPAPAPEEYVYRPYDNAAEPHLDAVRTFSRVVGRRLVPYVGLGALAAFTAVAVVRRVRR